MKQTTIKRDWFLLDFCQLGFIGKLFKSRDLSTLTLFFIIFRNEKPVDWLLVHLGETRFCRIDKDTKVRGICVYVGERMLFFT